MRILPLLLLLTSCTVHPKDKMSGLLLMDPYRNDTNFDLFYEYKLDPSKTLEQNIVSLQKGIGVHISIFSSTNQYGLVKNSRIMRNQAMAEDFDDHLKKVLVIPIVAELDLKCAEDFGDTKKLYSYPVRLLNNTLFENYQSKMIILKSYSIIPLSH